MSAQIVDNFKLNVAKPIDNRMVTTGTASRNSLTYIYEGLRVYDIVNRAPFVYIGGSWQQEGSTAGGGGGGGGSISPGTQDRLLKYINSTTVGNSTIVDKSLTFTTPNVGIGMMPSAGVALDVNGILKATSLKGSINGVYVDNGSIDNTKIIPGTDGQSLKTIGGQVVWTFSEPPNLNIVITNEISNSGIYFLLFANTSGNATGTPIYANNGTSRLIGIKPSTSQILASGDLSNNETQPTYSFSGVTNAGLYGNSTEVGLSFNSKALLKLNSTKLSIYDTSSNEVLSTGTNKVIFKSGEFTGTLDVTGLTTVGSLTVTGASTFNAINTTTLTVTGTATLSGLTVNGTTTFTTINATTLNVSGLSSLTELVVTSATSTMNSLSLSGALTVSGLTTLKDLTVNGTIKFNGSIQGSLVLSSNLTVNGDVTIGTLYGIKSDGTATFQSLDVTDPNGNSNDGNYGGFVSCTKIRVKPTSKQVPTNWSTPGYTPGDIIFVLDSGGQNGMFYFNQGPAHPSLDTGGGWVRLAH